MELEFPCHIHIYTFCPKYLKVLQILCRDLRTYKNNRTDWRIGKKNHTPCANSLCVVKLQCIHHWSMKVWHLQLTGTVNGKLQDTNHSTINLHPLYNCHSYHGLLFVLVSYSLVLFVSDDVELHHLLVEPQVFEFAKNNIIFLNEINIFLTLYY